MLSTRMVSFVIVAFLGCVFLLDGLPTAAPASPGHSATGADPQGACISGHVFLTGMAEGDVILRGQEVMLLCASGPVRARTDSLLTAMTVAGKALQDVEFPNTNDSVRDLSVRIGAGYFAREYMGRIANSFCQILSSLVVARTRTTIDGYYEFTAVQADTYYVACHYRILKRDGSTTATDIIWREPVMAVTGGVLTVDLANYNMIDLRHVLCQDLAEMMMDVSAIELSQPMLATQLRIGGLHQAARALEAELPPLFKAPAPTCQ